MSRPFSIRNFVDCLRSGAERFGWSRRTPRPATVWDGRWLVGMGMAGAILGGKIARSGARVRLHQNGTVTVETDMTDIGAGSYTIVAQTESHLFSSREAGQPSRWT